MTFLSTACAFVGTFFAAFGTIVLIHTPGENTELWGRKFPAIPKIKYVRIAGIAGWILLLLVLMWYYPFYLTGKIWDGVSTGEWLFPVLGVVAGFFTALLIIRPEPWMEQTIAHSKTALSLSELSILQEVDRHTTEAKTIVLNSDGIFLFDGQGYNFFAARFSDYKLGDLQNQEQMKLLGYYFRQKYFGIFQYSAKVDATYLSGVYVSSIGGTYTSVSSTTTPISAEVKQIAFKRIG